MVRRALLLTLTTALGAKPPPLTVRVKAGPPVATMEGEMDVICTPEPVRAVFCGMVAGFTLSATLRVAFSILVGLVGVKFSPKSQAWPGLRANVVGGNGQAGFVPLAENKWKSAGSAPGAEMVNPVAVTLTGAVPILVSVTIIVGLVLPIATGPKLTGLGVRMASGVFGVGTRPMI